MILQFGLPPQGNHAIEGVKLHSKGQQTLETKLTKRTQTTNQNHRVACLDQRTLATFTFLPLP